MDQERFVSILMEQELPDPYFRLYAAFRGAVRGDHIILLRFSCKCWRFIEVSVAFRGPMTRLIMGQEVPYGRYEPTWRYLFPKTQTDCIIRGVTDEQSNDWRKRKLKVHAISLPYKHHYFDHAFREAAKKIPSTIGPLVHVN